MTARMQSQWPHLAIQRPSQLSAQSTPDDWCGEPGLARAYLRYGLLAHLPEGRVTGWILSDDFSGPATNDLPFVTEAPRFLLVQPHRLSSSTVTKASPWYGEAGAPSLFRAQLQAGLSESTMLRIRNAAQARLAPQRHFRHRPISVVADLANPVPALLTSTAERQLVGVLEEATSLRQAHSAARYYVEDLVEDPDPRRADLFLGGALGRAMWRRLGDDPIAWGLAFELQSEATMSLTAAVETIAAAGYESPSRGLLDLDDPSALIAWKTRGGLDAAQAVKSDHCSPEVGPVGFARG